VTWLTYGKQKAPTLEHPHIAGSQSGLPMKNLILALMPTMAALGGAVAPSTSEPIVGSWADLAAHGPPWVVRAILLHLPAILFIPLKPKDGTGITVNTEGNSARWTVQAQLKGTRHDF